MLAANTALLVMFELKKTGHWAATFITVKGGRPANPRACSCAISLQDLQLYHGGWETRSATSYLLRVFDVGSHILIGGRLSVDASLSALHRQGEAVHDDHGLPVHLAQHKPHHLQVAPRPSVHYHLQESQRRDLAVLEIMVAARETAKAISPAAPAVTQAPAAPPGAAAHPIPSYSLVQGLAARISCCCLRSYL